MSLILDQFIELLNPSQRDIFTGFRTPGEIQAYLDQTPYSPENANRCPLQVMQDRLAHCLDGGIFAAAALNQLGYPALVIDMFPDPGKDDDHVLAIFKLNNRWGAVAKSNYTGLRFREPVYASLRELVMSYFEDFFNIYGEKTLRYYTTPFNLGKLDHMNWPWSNTAADYIEQRLKKIRRYSLLLPETGAILGKVDDMGMQAGMLGSNPDGLYKPANQDDRSG